MRDKTRVESSLPVQSRIDPRDLASMLDFYIGKGYQINSISQLVSWSVNLCVEALCTAGLYERSITDINEAYRMLEIHGLRQKSMSKVANKRLLSAKGFNELRIEGSDPKFESPSEYKRIHNRKTFDDQPVALDDGSKERRMSAIDRAFERIEEEKKKERELSRRDSMERLEFNEQGVHIPCGNSSTPKSMTNEDVQIARERIAEKDAKHQDELANMCSAASLFKK